MPKVTKIPATVDNRTHLPEMTRRKRRVAGYARVSTDSDEQFTSFAAQTEYYSNLIKANPDWEFVHVYTDEGISGLNTKKREGFREMINDALAGKIDLIITKSVSRFARNTVDSLKTIRELKHVGCEVYFEKENIYTFDGKGELLLTIMSSLAQEESRSISENVTWGQRRSFENGKVHLPYGRFLGYDRGEDGKPVVNPEQAKVVELIYRLFLDGKTSRLIAQELEQRGIPSPGGGAKWTKTTIDSILTNEKYKGDALLQKTFTVDFLEKTKKVNDGEVPQYYVEGSHEAIIDPDIWAHVQAEIARRKALGNTYSGKSSLCAKLVCEDCGGFYGRKVWHSTDIYKSELWQCNRKFDDKEHRCRTPKLTTEEIHRMFLQAYNRQMQDLPRIISDCEMMRKVLCNFSDLDEAMEQKRSESEVIADRVRKLIRENASVALDQDDYNQKEQALNQKFNEVTEALTQLAAERKQREQKNKAMGLYIRTLKKSPLVLTEWDDTIWIVMVEKAIVHRDRSITFVFYNGQEITVEAE